jgi:hypothetical protein
MVEGSMRARFRNRAWRSTTLVVAAVVISMAAPIYAGKGKLSQKEWVITITAPDSETGYHFGTQTFTIKARNNDFPPSPLPLRQLTASSTDGTVVQGVWRQQGKKFSLTFELPCAPDAACATVILRGKTKSETKMKGQTILILDNRDRKNVAGFETVNGTFEGVQQ